MHHIIIILGISFYSHVSCYGTITVCTELTTWEEKHTHNQQVAAKSWKKVKLSSLFLGKVERKALKNGIRSRSSECRNSPASEVRKEHSGQENRLRHS